MQELLGTYKKTKAVSDKMPVMHVPIDSINVDVIVYNILNFKVGQFVDLFGSTELICLYRNGPMIMIPESFELRVRGINALQFSLFYPTGYLVWNRILEYDMGEIEFKAQAMQNEDKVPYIKIWRSK